MVPVTAFLKGVHCSQHQEIGFCLCASYLSQVRWHRPREKEFIENVKVCSNNRQDRGVASNRRHPVPTNSPLTKAPHPSHNSLLIL